MTGWSSRRATHVRSSTCLFPRILRVGKNSAPRIKRASRPAGRSMNTAESPLAHLAANVLILLALLYDCRLICRENLTTLKSEGRGRGVRGRWRNWRNNNTVRGELWRVLKYKCHLLGIRARQVEPRGTTHTCPHCGKPAHTYRSPAKTDQQEGARSGRPGCVVAIPRAYGMAPARLRCQSQYRQARSGLSHDLSPDLAVPGVPPD